MLKGSTYIASIQSCVCHLLVDSLLLDKMKKLFEPKDMQKQGSGVKMLNYQCNLQKQVEG